MAERKPLGPVANGRNHTITGVLVVLGVKGLSYCWPELGEVEAAAISATVIGGVLGFGASMLRSFTAARGGKSLAADLGKRAAGWLGCFAAAVLLTGCAFESAKFNLAAADSEAETMSGGNITVTDPETGESVVCEGEGCRWRRAISRGFSIPFTGVLARLVEGAAALVGASSPGAPQPIEISVEGVTVSPTAEAAGD